MKMKSPSMFQPCAPLLRMSVGGRSVCFRDDEISRNNERLQAEKEPQGVRSAGCSPAMGRRLRFLGCAGPSFDSSYQLADNNNILGDPVDTMSPRTRRSRLRKIIASLTPAKKHKSMISLDVEPREDGYVTAAEEPTEDPPPAPQCRLIMPAGSSTDKMQYDLNYVTLLVRIRLKEGQGLAVRDASGSSDPYVKFKYKDRIVYKSNTIFKNLNPVWDEDFQMLADDMTAPIGIEVYDYDRFCTDDFMGGATIDISQVKWFTPFESCIPLVDEGNTTEELGTVSLSICIVPQTQQEKEQFLQKSNRGVMTESQKKREKLVQMWSSVVNIVLVEGRGLSINYNMTSPPDPFCKFKLGCEKYKSKVVSRSFDPKWIEQFDLHLYEGGGQLLEVLCHDKKTNAAIGKASVDLSCFPRDQTVQKWFDLDESAGSVLLLITVSGSQSTDSVVDLTEFNQNDVRHAIVNKYDLFHSFDNMKDIGQLTVKVFRGDDLLAKDLGGKSDPFAVLELVNTRLQTHTEYKTLNPQWNKLFTFGVKDIHSVLEVTVFDEDPNNKFEFMGKVSIPLMSIRNCERRWYALKDKKQQQRVKGEILLELDVIWNPIRAAVRTFNPREKKYIEQEPKFKSSLFRATVMELKEFGLGVVDCKNYVQSCFDWDSTPRSITAFLLFLLLVYYLELFHLPLLLLLLFGRCLILRKAMEGRNIERTMTSKDDDEAEEEKRLFFRTSTKPPSPAKKKDDSGSSSLRDTLSSVQETLGVVQNLLVFVCSLLQRIKNTFNFTNPWLSWLAVFVLAAAALLLYMVPLRWILMIWGVNKFTKKLRNPHFIDNNELLDYLSRVPSDSELVYDYDRFCTDDFMGGATIDISQVKWFTPFESCIPLVDEGNTTEELGTVSLSICIVPQTQQEKEQFLQKSNRGVMTESQKKREKLVQMWSSVVNIVLVEGRGLSIKYNMTSPPEPFCKFKLGCEKYKSKVVSRNFDPKWIEQFDLHLYEGGGQLLEVLCHDKKTNAAIGKASVDLSCFPRDQTVQKWFDLDESAGSVLLLITVSGSQSTDSVVDLTEFNQNDVRHAIVNKYDLFHSFDNMKDIGQLTVKVFRGDDLLAKDLGGKSDPFAVLELVNTRLQTHTEYKTLNPQWNKLFTFGANDIHSVLEVTVFDEDPNNKFEFMGKVSIPLMSIRNCERRWYALKDKKQQQRVKGEILLELDVIWNPIRAAVRTFNPREKKYIEQEPKFKSSLFRATVMELKEFGLGVVDCKNYVQSCFDWDSTPRSITAFLLFLLLVYYLELFHLPLLLLLLFGRCLILRKAMEGRHIERTMTSKDDDEAEEEKRLFFRTSTKPPSPVKKKDDSGSSSLRDTLSSVQETLGVVQNLLVFVCSLLQRIKNTFNFTNPWLSWLAVFVLAAAALLLYLVPLRWILMIWGVNKFTKKLRNPHFIDNNELLDYLSRVPSDSELREWQDVRVERTSESRKSK